MNNKNVEYIKKIPVKKTSWEKDISSKKRFRFGRNWIDFSELITEEKIAEAQSALTDSLKTNTLEGKSFLDIGCGSGLMSLVARNLGAEVCSFDFDPDSVSCSKNIRKRFMRNDPKWKIIEGSALDQKFLKNLDKFDIVYSWGVLHHTGEMWKALENALIPLAEKNSILFIAIYNDEGSLSKFWLKIKKLYNRNKLYEALIKSIFIPLYTFAYLILGLVKHKNIIYYFRSSKKNNRGMSIFYDFIDWLGGYPFEVAKPEEIINFYQEKGLKLFNLKTTNRLGCNQFIFKK